MRSGDLTNFGNCALSHSKAVARIQAELSELKAQVRERVHAYTPWAALLPEFALCARRQLVRPWKLRSPELLEPRRFTPSGLDTVNYPGNGPDRIRACRAQS